MVDHQRKRRVLVVLLGFLCLQIGCTLGQELKPLSSITERKALFELRSSLGVRARDWPRKADPCLVWRGVECNEGGRVIGINIAGFKRTRVGSENPKFAVDSLGNLTLLVSFNSSGFSLPGSVPDWFGVRMMSLQILDLSSCSVSGTIPLNLGNLTSLTGLYLSHNSLTGIIPSSLGQLHRLSVLDLSQNLLTGSIPILFQFIGNLSVFDVSSNFLSGSIPPTIGILSQLTVLNLSNNSFSSSIPGQLGDLHKLVDLDLSFNSLSGPLPMDFGGLRRLQKIVIKGNSLTGSLPGKLFDTVNRLQFIDLSHNGFNGTFPDVFWSISVLRFLDVAGNNFTGTLPNLSLNISGTEALFNLSGNKFYGNLTSVLNILRFVDLSYNYLEGEVPNYARINEALNLNCLQNVSSQRTLAECQSFYSERGQIFDNFGFPNDTPPAFTPKKSGENSHENLIILASVLGGLGIIVLLFLCILLFLYARRRGVSTQGRNGVGPVPTESRSTHPGGESINFTILGETFTYQQLLQATSEFNESNLIKHGHTGDVFRGILEGGIPVVIKRVNLQTLKKESYLSELNFLSKVSHIRLVPFIGKCLENENEKFLVYKYMPNADLSNALYKKGNSEDDSLQSLDWITRLKIAIGAAEGLTYLHQECTPPLVHRDVQASSILLDDRFEVRLGSLGKVCAQEEDTHQRKISRLLRIQSFNQDSSGSLTATCTYDVYCFGKVLLELLTGKLGMSAASETSTKEWLDETLPNISIYDKELVLKIVDPSLIIDEDLLEEVWAVAIVARSCLNPKPSRRPLMRYILKALENPFRVVRDESSGSARLKATSSRGSWNAGPFGSWRHSSIDAGAIPSGSRNKAEVVGTTTESQGSSGKVGVGENSSSSHRRYSKEMIHSEPSNVHDV